MKFVVTGSEGLVGKSVVSYLMKNGHEVEALDLSLGHDLTNEIFVNEWFRDHRAEALVNLFALNQHISELPLLENYQQIELEEFDMFLQVNVTALFSVCRKFILYNSNARILNFSSVYGVVTPQPSLYEGGHKHVAYGVSKAAVISLSRYLAVHAGQSVRVNCIVLGGLESEQSTDFVERYSKRTPLLRMGQPEEIGPVVEFLLSPANTYMTGSVISIDGGWTA
jgi:NAD(P)-dependent dehydrogenase (short-subunit alcohol dehydrogenase family)